MPRIIDQFWRKRCQKKRKDVGYKLLYEFFQKYFVVREQSAVENSISTYICYAPDGLFWLNLYLTRNREPKSKQMLEQSAGSLTSGCANTVFSVRYNGSTWRPRALAREKSCWLLTTCCDNINKKVLSGSFQAKSWKTTQK